MSIFDDNHFAVARGGLVRVYTYCVGHHHLRGCPIRCILTLAELHLWREVELSTTNLWCYRSGSMNEGTRTLLHH